MFHLEEGWDFNVVILKKVRRWKLSRTEEAKKKYTLRKVPIDVLCPRAECFFAFFGDHDFHVEAFSHHKKSES